MSTTTTSIQAAQHAYFGMWYMHLTYLALRDCCFANDVLPGTMMLPQDLKMSSR